MSLSINLIGAGRLGIALGRAIATLRDYQLLGICNQHWHKTQEAIALIDEGVAYPSIMALPWADITFITTPDDRIADVAGSLSEHPALKPHSIVVHCSGVLEARELDALSNKGCLTASIHPMRSFALPLDVDFQQAVCVLEGNQTACTILSTLFSKLGAIVMPIQGKQKPLYHAAGVFGSNFLITLTALASDSLKKAGFSDDVAIQTTIDLMQGSLDNLKRTDDIKASLTGPFARGDIDTIRKHLDNLTGEPKTLYAALGQLTLSLSNLDDAKKACISELLTQV